MNEFTRQALAYLKDHWHKGMTGTSDAAQLLGINPNTFKTRMTRGQALVLRNENGSRVRPLTFTGYHLVYNLLSDRLLRYGFSVEHDETTTDVHPDYFATWIENNIVSGRYQVDTVFKIRKTGDGEVHPLVIEDGIVDKWPNDASVFIPIGSMIVELSARLYMSSFSDEQVSAALAGYVARDRDA